MRTAKASVIESSPEWGPQTHANTRGWAPCKALPPAVAGKQKCPPTIPCEYTIPHHTCAWMCSSGVSSMTRYALIVSDLHNEVVEQQETKGRQDKIEGLRVTLLIRPLTDRFPAPSRSTLENHVHSQRLRETAV